jgi:hypothetical protein
MLDWYLKFSRLTAQKWYQHAITTYTIPNTNLLARGGVSLSIHCVFKYPCLVGVLVDLDILIAYVRVCLHP